VSRRRWFDWHSQVGILAGLLLFVVCWSGTVATLSHEIDGLLNPAQRLAPAETRASWGEIIEAAQRAHPEAKARWASAPLYSNFAAEVVMSTPDDRSIRVFVDPYRAKVTGTTTYFNVQRFFRSFHMSLFDWGGTMAGYYVVCALSVVLLASFVTSLVFYKRWWRGFLTLKTTSGARVFWADSHKLLGVWSLWFVLLMAVTGGWYLFEAARYDIDPVGSEGPFAIPDVPPVDGAATSAEIDTLIAVAQRAHPALEIRSVSLYDDGLVSVDGQSVHWLVRDRANAVHVARASGEVVLDQRADQLNAYWRWSDTADPLHFGAFGGLATKLLWFAFGLVLSALSLTGAYLHHQRIIARGADRVAVTRGARRIATVVTVAVLGWSIGGGWAEISAYGIDGLSSLLTMTPIGVWVFLTAWLLLTLGVLAVWVRRLG
jgi:uncharacterized iron-regulated membrane protein